MGFGSTRSEKTPRRSAPWRAFLLGLTLVVLLTVSALYTGILVNGRRAIEAELRARARAIFNSIVLVRKWNSEHGGVFVRKTPGMQSNSYLPSPDIVSADGRVFTMKNPALMAREISEIATKDGAFQFHITSARPINPANAPDAFEAQALAAFDAGSSEQMVRERRNGASWFRYMAPLYVEQSCLPCHAPQGYRVGQIRGGISVTFNIDEAERVVARGAWSTVGLYLVTALGLLAVLWRLVAVLHRRLEAAEARIQEMAITDELTGMHNRRYVSQRLAEEVARADRHGRPLSCVIFDVDDFKRVNDTFGHDAGDTVLKAVGAAAERQRRQSDVLGRWGGEEFLLVLPETQLGGARAIAGRLRQGVEELRIEHAERTILVTASLGVATWEPGAGTASADPLAALLKRADEALYRAKEGGKNRVESAP